MVWRCFENLFRIVPDITCIVLLCAYDARCWLQTRTGGENFTVLAGPCTSADGCIQSPNHPNKYGNSEFCQIVAPAKPFFITHFETGAGNDNLTINGHVYSGSSAPPQGIITSDAIQWQSSDATTASGWRICTSFGLKLGFLRPGCPKVFSETLLTATR